MNGENEAMTYDDFQLVRDVQTAVGQVVDRCGERWRLEDERRKHLLADLETLRNLPEARIAGMQKDIETENRNRNRLVELYEVFREFASSDRRFTWSMPDDVWATIKEESGLPSDAGRTLEALVVFNGARLKIERTATPDYISQLLNEIDVFVHAAAVAMAQPDFESRFSIFLRDCLQEHFVPKADGVDAVAELKSALVALHRIRQKFPGQTSKQSQLKYLLDQLDDLLRLFANRPLSRGSARNADVHGSKGIANWSANRPRDSKRRCKIL